MLDTNIYCRPFDDLNDPVIKEESNLAEKILELSENKKIEILSSDVLYAELTLIRDAYKKDVIFNEIKSFAQERVSANKVIDELALEIKNLIGNYGDSLHIAFAAFSNCTCFITCDKDLIKIREKIESFLTSKSYKLRLLSPEEFIRLKWN